MRWDLVVHAFNQSRNISIAVHWLHYSFAKLIIIFKQVRCHAFSFRGAAISMSLLDLWLCWLCVSKNDSRVHSRVSFKVRLMEQVRNYTLMLTVDEWKHLPGSCRGRVNRIFSVIYVVVFSSDGKIWLPLLSDLLYFPLLSSWYQLVHINS